MNLVRLICGLFVGILVLMVNLHLDEHSTSNVWAFASTTRAPTHSILRSAIPKDHAFDSKSIAQPLEASLSARSVLPLPAEGVSIAQTGIRVLSGLCAVGAIWMLIKTSAGRICSLVSYVSSKEVLRPLNVIVGITLTSGALAVQSATGIQNLNLSELAKLEPDPEIALELWDAAIEASNATDPSLLIGRANANLLLANWTQAEADFIAALTSSQASAQGMTISNEAAKAALLDAALAWDGKGIAEAQQGKWVDAIASFKQALGRIGQAGAAADSVPDGTPFSGLRGGAPTLVQRVELHEALALVGAGKLQDAIVALQRIDKGPAPDGFPQFWDARAALAMTLSASGQPRVAELEWADLCQAVPQPPPATPTNPVFSQVNKAAQLMLDVQGSLYDKGCEDYTTGVYLPCDDAGIPGLGGSSAPCALYTPEEVTIRLWPPTLIKELSQFRARVLQP